jgi:hypothetical protein
MCQHRHPSPAGNVSLGLGERDRHGRFSTHPSPSTAYTSVPHPSFCLQIQHYLYYSCILISGRKGLENVCLNMKTTFSWIRHSSHKQLRFLAVFLTPFSTPTTYTAVPHRIPCRTMLYSSYVKMRMGYVNLF